MNKINLNSLDLKTFTEQDAEDYCSLNIINNNPDNITYLDLGNNELTDISTVQYLTKLKTLSITNLELESSQIKYINSIKNLKELWCINGFK